MNQRSLQRQNRRGVLARMLVIIMVTLACLSVPPSTGASTQPPAAQDEFVPAAEIPAEDQLPAAPLLVAAYAFAWLALGAYVVSLWRRLGSVERDLHALTGRLAARGR